MRNIQLLKGGVHVFPFTAEAAIMIAALQNEKIDIKSIFDNADAICGQLYDGIPIEKPYETESAVIICGHKHYEKAVIFKNSVLLEDVLTREDFDNVYPKINQSKFTELAPRQKIRIERFEHEIASYRFEERKSEDLLLSQVQLCVTTVCTLRCRDCGDLMPYYKTPYHVPIENIISDVNALLRIVDFVRVLAIYGGETFLYPQLEELLRYLHTRREMFGMIDLGINGTVIPTDGVCDAMRWTNAVVRISDYGDYSNKKQEIIDKLNQFGVHYQIYEFQKNIKWYPIGQPIYDLLESDEEVAQKFMNCTSRLVCNHLYRSNYYYCSFIAHMEELHGIPYQKENSLNIYTCDKNELRNYIFNRRHPDACRYCTSVSHNLAGFKPAIQMKGTRECKHFDETYDGVS